MRSKGYRAPKGQARLKAFLARATHPEGTLSLGEVRGFLFALNAAPELVKPSDWIPFVFSGEEPEFRDLEEAEEVMGALMQLYNSRQLRRLPEGPQAGVMADSPGWTGALGSLVARSQDREDWATALSVSGVVIEAAGMVFSTRADEHLSQAIWWYNVSLPKGRAR
jgi:yecA family protein